MNKWVIQFEDKNEFDAICNTAQNRNFRWKYFYSLIELMNRNIHMTKGYIYFEIINGSKIKIEKLISLRSKEDKSKFTEQITLEEFKESDLGL